MKISNVRQYDLRYFVERLNGEYVFYFEKEGSIIMREYARRYDFDKERHTQDSMRVLSSRLDTDEKNFNYRGPIIISDVNYNLYNNESFFEPSLGKYVWNLPKRDKDFSNKNSSSLSKNNELKRFLELNTLLSNEIKK